MEEAEKANSLLPKLEVLSFQAPQAFVASSALG